jgi:hypothetical protein
MFREDEFAAEYISSRFRACDTPEQAVTNSYELVPLVITYFSLNSALS